LVQVKTHTCTALRHDTPMACRLGRPLRRPAVELDALRVSTLPLMVLILVLAGCGSTAPMTPDRYYSLAPAPLEAPVGAPLPATLLVNDLAARGFLGGRQIIFRTHEAPLLVQRYNDLLWEEPVTRAMSRNLVNAIRTARVFQFTLIPADRGRADYILGGEVERFEHLPTTVPPRVVATLNLALVRANDRKSLWNRRYSGDVQVEGATSEAMVEAFNRLAAQLAADVVRDLRTLPPRADGTP
jgi:cholesterol transport system auxiliary component